MRPSDTGFFGGRGGVKGYLVDVFTTEVGEGNPAAVVLDAGGLSGVEMAGIAVGLGLETTFVDGVTLRYYMPEGQPMNLCGHGTIGALAVMGREGRFSVETPAGRLGVDVQPYLLGMAMPGVTVGEPVGVEEAALALGLELSEIDGPVQALGAGRLKLMVPVVSTAVLDRIVPDQAKIAEACAATGTTGLYPFTRHARGFGAHADARQFPVSGGILEDPVTGTAAVALAWYLWRQGWAPGCGALKIEQGYAMGRPGRVLVRQEPGGHAWIYGQAVVARTMEV
jgi:trans-2,3-dihydro-3-hydroxyanthranilate isomerase